MRGKRTEFATGAVRDRITPADAGKTFRPPLQAPSCIGSPPQMRGKRVSAILLRCDDWITPADAGKTECLKTRCAASSDHPRRCGENDLESGCKATGRGSPPQMRGKLSSGKPILSATGITPADAGKTYCPCLSPWAAQDHPRRCGENPPQRSDSQPLTGSPPQMRGKLQLATGLGKTVRITPADAGKTCDLMIYSKKS